MVETTGPIKVKAVKVNSNVSPAISRQILEQHHSDLKSAPHLPEKAWRNHKTQRLCRSTTIKGGSGLNTPTKPLSVILVRISIAQTNTNTRCTNTLKSYIQSCSLEEGRKGDERGWLNQKTNPTKIAWHITIGRLFESQSMYFYLLPNDAVFKTRTKI